MRIKYWGVRGSIPTPERRNSRYGGNTTCIEVRLANGTLIILDCGSGLRSLGKNLLREFGDSPLRGYIFLTHFHWDHIQGAPFFPLLYSDGNEFFFHAVRRKEEELKAAIEGQMTMPYFPVDMTMLHSTRHFYDLDYNPIEINGAVIRSAPLNHPQGCVGYRIEADGVIFVFATDTEPGSPFHDRSVRELAQGADVFAYDAQYTPEQLRGARKGWGHSSWLEATRIANECGVRQLMLFHHDPDHADIVVDSLVEEARREFPNTIGAAEGLELGMPGGIMKNGYLGSFLERRQEHRYKLELPVRIAWKAQTGERHEARSTAFDISKSGIYFIVPDRVPIGQSVELEMTLPDAITHRGDLLLHFSAELLREGENGPFGFGIAGRGVAARLTSHLAHSQSHAA